MKDGHSENGTYSLGDNLQTHPQGRSMSIAHRGNGYNSSPVSCLPQSNVNFSNGSQSSPNAHQMHLNQNIPLSKHQYYAQNQNVINTMNKKSSNNNNNNPSIDIDLYEQQLKLSQQKNQELENQCKNQNEQMKDLKVILINLEF